MSKDKTQKLHLNRLLQMIQTGGLLSETLKGFEVRESQQKMLANVVDVYNNQGIALIEAGTGTGKSIAYLIPALLWAAINQERTLISTNTIALQEQLIHKDIPALTKLLGIEVKAVLVKGMNNYLCLRKLEELQYELALLPPEESSELEKIEAWASTTKEGSRSDLKFVPSYNAWNKVSAEQESCNNRHCQYYKDCFFFKARQRAEDAHILVANHYMLFADLASMNSKEEKVSSGILPPYTRLILDEAHHIEEVATEFLSLKSSKLGLLHLVGRLVGEKQGKINNLKQKLLNYYKGNFSQEINAIYSRLNIELPAIRRHIYQDLDNMFLAYEELLTRLNAQVERGASENKLRLLRDHLNHEEWKNTIIPYTRKVVDQLKSLLLSIYQILRDLKFQDDENLDEALKGVRLDIEGASNRLSNAIETLNLFIQEPQPSEVRWIESQQMRDNTNTYLVNAKLDIAPTLNEALFSRFPTIVLCSATLTTQKEFNFFKERLGLTEGYLKGKRLTENGYPSPFDFSKQSCFYIPKDLPEPHEVDFLPKAIEMMWDAIQASRGNTFILFTSYQMLQQCYNILAKRLQEKGYHPMKQGETNRQALIDRFKTTDRSILFGTDSFWEGVDVSGEALRCVIIVKLPFRVPSEPMIEARAESISQKGGNPFNEYHLPQAIVKFKQGVGRLIRKKSDRGCILCLDVRLLKKGYGEHFLNSLPECQRLVVESQHLRQKMEEFYKRTYYLVAQK